ncbi:MAG: motility associated factor glycosyltransferase family protein, partial [Deltaproteobacteria bacterium]|nr:motility associated factor glycosyltransferase family protein [Deltaproteobacteria bacterium]
MIRHNTLARGSLWAQYEIENMRDTVLLPPITALKRYARKAPGIFVGAGPSLSKNIHLLKEFKNHAVVIAAATALRPLDAAGVKPDIAMVIESNPSHYQFEGLSFLNDLVLSPTPYSNPENFKLPVKRVMPLLNHPSPTHDWMTRAYGSVDSVLTAGSVALAAFSTLHRIGCDPIIAVGMDLAFTDEQTHAEGADSAAEEIRYNEELKRLEYIVKDPDSPYFSKFACPGQKLRKGEVRGFREAMRCESWGGDREVFSDVTFTAYRAWLEGAADTWAGDRELINSTEGGARITGFRELPLSEVMKKCTNKDYPVSKWVDEICQTYTPPDLSPLRQEIESELRLIRSVEQQTIRCRDLASKATSSIRANKVNGVQKLLDSLGAIEKELGANSKKTRILNQISQQAATTIRLERHEDKHIDPLVQMANSLMRSIKLFDKITSGCREAAELFEKALRQLK